MIDAKKWGIKINGSWITSAGEAKDMVYYMKRRAQQEADDFNSMRKKGDNPYIVQEYK
jgi:hypothetical protein